MPNSATESYLTSRLDLAQSRNQGTPSRRSAACLPALTNAMVPCGDLRNCAGWASHFSPAAVQELQQEILRGRDAPRTTSSKRCHESIWDSSGTDAKLDRDRLLRRVLVHSFVVLTSTTN